MNNIGSLGRDTVTPFHKPTAPARSKAVVTRQLEILALRSFDLADRVAAGELPFIDAVDLAYSAAIWADLPNVIDRSGLINFNIAGASTGQDIVQATIAAAFATVRGLA
jgi:hypothetical protein